MYNVSQANTNLHHWVSVIHFLFICSSDVITSASGRFLFTHIVWQTPENFTLRYARWAEWSLPLLLRKNNNTLPAGEIPSQPNAALFCSKAPDFLFRPSQKQTKAEVDRWANTAPVCANPAAYGFKRWKTHASIIQKVKMWPRPVRSVSVAQSDLVWARSVFVPTEPAGVCAHNFANMFQVTLNASLPLL